MGIPTSLGQSVAVVNGNDAPSNAVGTVTLEYAFPLSDGVFESQRVVISTKFFGLFDFFLPVSLAFVSSSEILSRKSSFSSV